MNNKFAKRAWKRDRSVPQGQPAKGHFDCECGNQTPPSDYNDKQPDITCKCGRVYRWDGWIIK